MIGAVAKWALAVILAVSSGAKLVTGFNASYWIPLHAFYGIAVLEVVAVMLLVFKRPLFAQTLALLLAAGGVSAALLSDAPCGCFGSLLRENRALQIVLSAVVGGLACALTVAAPSTGHSART